MSNRVVQRRKSSFRLKDHDDKAFRTDAGQGRFRYLPATPKSPATYFASASSPSVYISQNAESLLSPRHSTTVLHNRDHRSRSRIDATDVQPLLASWSGPGDKSRRSRSTTPQRSNSDARTLQRESGRPVLIRQNDRDFYRAELLGRAMDQNGKEFMVISYNPDLAAKGVPVAKIQSGVTLRRSVSAAPELERVREWLSKNDFSHGLDGMPVDKTRWNQPDTNPKYNTAEGSQTGKPTAISKSLPSLPPPIPSSVPPKLPKDNLKIKQPLMELPSAPRPLTSKTNSPEISLTSQSFSLKDMPPIARDEQGFLDIQLQNPWKPVSNLSRHLSLRDERRPPLKYMRHSLSSSQNQFDVLVDSIFSKALGDEGNEDGVKVNKRDNGFMVSGKSAPPTLRPRHDNRLNGLRDPMPHSGKGSSAEMMELKEKLKSKGAGSEMSYNSIHEMRELSQRNTGFWGNCGGNGRTAVYRTDSDAFSEMSNSKFTPLATSTPPLPLSPSSPKLQAQTFGNVISHSQSPPLVTARKNSHSNISPHFSQLGGSTRKYSNISPHFSQLGGSTRRNSNAVDTLRATSTTRSGSQLSYKEQHSASALGRDKEKNHNGVGNANAESPHPLSKTQSHLIDLNGSNTAGVHVSGGAGSLVGNGFVSSSNAVFRPVTVTVTEPSQQFNEASRESGRVRINVVATSHVQSEQSRSGESRGRSAPQAFCETNTAYCAQTGEEFFNTRETGADPENKERLTLCLPTSRKTEDQRRDGLSSDSQVGNIPARNGLGKDLTQPNEKRRDVENGKQPKEPDEWSKGVLGRDGTLFSIVVTQSGITGKSAVETGRGLASFLTKTDEHGAPSFDTLLDDKCSRSDVTRATSDNTGDPCPTSGGYTGQGSSSVVPAASSELGSRDYSLFGAGSVTQVVYERPEGKPEPALHHEDLVLPISVEPTPSSQTAETRGSESNGGQSHRNFAHVYGVPSVGDSQHLTHERFPPHVGVWTTDTFTKPRSLYAESVTIFGSELSADTRKNNSECHDDDSSVLIHSAGTYDWDDLKEPLRRSYRINTRPGIDFFPIGLRHTGFYEGARGETSESTNSRADLIDRDSVVLGETTVSDNPFLNACERRSKTVSVRRTKSETTIVIDSDINDDDVDDDGWTSNSSSSTTPKTTHFPRFASTCPAAGQDSLNAIFTHRATTSLRARADRTLTGSQHNLTSGWPLSYSDDSDEEDNDKNHPSGQSRSAPNSSRQKRRISTSLTAVKFLAGSFLDLNKIPVSDVTSDLTETQFVQYTNDQNDNDNENEENNELASPTTIKISSNTDGSKLVRIFQKPTVSDKHNTIARDSIMLGNNNHDHEMLPPSAANPASNKGGYSHYASGSLLRSKGLFSSTPSLFSRSSPEEKFWKKEQKREKEGKKKMEEEKKRLEKLEKKEEKKRKKMEKKAATLNARTVPRNWNYVARPIESVYMRPKLKMRAVQIEYTDDPRIPPPHQPPPPPPGHHYATSSVALRGGYTMYASTPDLARVEQVYGTSHRHRPAHPSVTSSHYASPYGYPRGREQHPRVVLLHRSAEGYGFVLRGAKSKLPTGGGFNDFTPTAEYPALQYLDSVDPGSQADRAGLKGGDFILEINGENVVRASHEHVVHLIRSSSDVLTLKVVTVSHADRTPADWFSHSESGAMTLPTRKKQAAPLPPQRDPRTSLSYSKASSRSMTEGLAEIEKLDAAIAEFEGQEVLRRHSLHGLQAADDPKVASVRASHTVKRVSVVDYEGLMPGEPGNAPSPNTKSSRDYMSPAEARIKKYHKKSASQTMERSKSTPDILSAVDHSQGNNGHYAVGKISGSWTKGRAPPPPPHAAIYSGALQTSPTSESSRLVGAVAGGKGIYSGRHSGSSTPELPDRMPVHQKTAPGAPPTPEVVRINTRGKDATYANVSAEIQSRKAADSSYESSFRPGINAKLVDNPKGVVPPPEQTILKNNKRNVANQNMDKSISFADEHVMENAQKFIQKYPNATVLVTAGIRPDKVDVKKNRKDGSGVVYEPEPDYDDSDDEKPVFSNVGQVHHGAPRAGSDTSKSSSVVRQNRGSVTVISITNDSSKGSNKPPVNATSSSNQSSPRSNSSAKSSPLSPRVQEKTTLASPVQSLSSSRRSSGIVMATPSQPSSAESSRRSSIQSNLSGETGEKNNRLYSSSSTSAISMSKSDSGSRINIGGDAPPPPPPGPPPPPAPPLPATLGMSSSPASSANSTLVRRRQQENDAASVLPNRVSTEDILAAVAERRNRLETEGPRVSDVKSIPTTKSSHELNHEALKAAVAKRKSRMEQQEDQSVVDEIEARLHRNKKLQAVKFFGGDARKIETKKVEPVPASPPEPVVAAAAPSTVKAEEEHNSGTLKPKDIAARFEPNKPLKQVKLSPVVPLKTNQNKDKPADVKETSNNSGNGTIDFRSKLKPVDTKASATPVAIQAKTTSPASPNMPKSPTPVSNVSTITATKTTSNKAPAPPPPPLTASTTTPTVSSSLSVSNPKPKPELPTLLTSKTSKPGTPKSGSPAPGSPNPAAGAISPASSNIASSADYIALAEKARQEYLKKKASGNLQPHIEKKGPVEITPNRKNPARGKPASPASPRSPTVPATKSSGTNVIEVKPAHKSGEEVQVSVGDRIKNLQSGNIYANGKTSLEGVTEDHSHTEQSLSNGTIKKPKSNGNISPPPNLIAPPPPGFGDADTSSSASRGVVIDIIPPPSTFSSADNSPSNPPPFGQEDSASFVSSVSSLSTLSSEQGESIHPDKMNIEDLIAPPPPPPPDFGDSTLGDQDAYIPPPPEFLEIDSNANESKALDKNSKPFAAKSVTNWSCMDVLDWLDSLGLPQYRISFAKACVDGSKLVSMGRNEFINLGVSQVGHRMNLERSVKKLNLAASTNL